MIEGDPTTIPTDLAASTDGDVRQEELSRISSSLVTLITVGLLVVCLVTGLLCLLLYWCYARKSRPNQLQAESVLPLSESPTKSSQINAASRVVDPISQSHSPNDEVNFRNSSLKNYNEAAPLITCCSHDDNQTSSSGIKDDVEKHSFPPTGHFLTLPESPDRLSDASSLTVSVQNVNDLAGTGSFIEHDLLSVGTSVYAKLSKMGDQLSVGTDQLSVRTDQLSVGTESPCLGRRPGGDSCLKPGLMLSPTSCSASLRKAVDENSSTVSSRDTIGGWGEKENIDANQTVVETSKLNQISTDEDDIDKTYENIRFSNQLSCPLTFEQRVSLASISSTAKVQDYLRNLSPPNLESKYIDFDDSTSVARQEDGASVVVIKSSNEGIASQDLNQETNEQDCRNSEADEVSSASSRTTGLSSGLSQQMSGRLSSGMFYTSALPGQTQIQFLDEWQTATIPESVENND